MRRRPLALVVALAAAVALTGCNDGASRTSVEPVSAPTSAAAEPSETPATELTPEPIVTDSATPTPPPSATPTKAAPPKPTYDVAAVQRRLTELKYYVGAVDAKPGAQLRSAVMAFQKVQGLKADGVVGKGVLDALAAPKAPALKATAPANRVEVDLTKQVLYVVKGGAVSRVLPVSSGNGATYKQKNGATARALTPVGWYKIERRIVGERKADLGSLYDPQYFYRGWAIHGSNSVPAGPASHGCVRVTRWDATWLLGQIGVGTSVYLYGGTYTFTAGSSAPGTDNPTGDDGGAPAPAPKPTTPAPAPVPPPATTPAAAPTATATTTP